MASDEATASSVTLVAEYVTSSAPTAVLHVGVGGDVAAITLASSSLTASAAAAMTAKANNAASTTTSTNSPKTTSTTTTTVTPTMVNDVAHRVDVWRRASASLSFQRGGSMSVWNVAERGQTTLFVLIVCANVVLSCRLVDRRAMATVGSVVLRRSHITSAYRSIDRFTILVPSMLTSFDAAR